MNRILPLELKSKIQTECWTYYKLAIIETLPNYENWLSSHMSVCIDTVDEQVYFGNENKPHPLEYYSEILDIEELDLCSIYSDSLIEKIKERINNGWYFVTFVCDENEYLHEVFLYGYADEENTLFSISLNERGHFEQRIISNEWLKIGYQRLLEYFKRNPESYYSRRDYGYLIFCLRPCYKYFYKDYAADYFCKLAHEVYGMRADLFYSRRNAEYLASKSYYTGIACLLKVREQLISLRNVGIITKDDSALYFRKKALFKLLEHRSIIVDSMRWHRELWQITEPSLLDLEKEYMSLFKAMEISCMLFLKYMNQLDINIIDNIIQRLDIQYRSEKECLGIYISGIRDWYFHHVLSQKLEKLT